MSHICCRGIDPKHCVKCLDTTEIGVNFRQGSPIPVNCKWLQKPEPKIEGKYPRLKTSREITFWDVVDEIREHGHPDQIKQMETILADIKTCKCKNRWPRLQANFINEFRKFIKPKVLIVGNANIPIDVDCNLYDDVVIFNRPRHPELMSYCTYHYMRTYRTDLLHHSGEELVPLHDGAPIYVESGQAGRALAAQYKARGGDTFSCRQWIDYPQDKVPSTGIAVIKHFLSRGYDVDIACFSWQGSKSHDWAFEKDLCQKLLASGEIRMIGSEI